MHTSLSFYLIISTLQFVVGDDGCIRQEPCLCRFSNGSVIDLKPINTDHRDGSSWMFDFQDQSMDPGNFKYAFNPCYPMKGLADKENVCNKNLACQEYSSQDPKGADYFPLADPSTETFAMVDGTVTVTYSAVLGGKTRTLHVNLICGEGAAVLTVVGQPTTDLNYVYNLTASECCPKEVGGLSLGTILCIIFVVIVVVYLVVGVLINKFARGATGAELIPNRSFWAELPSLIKEGFQFTASKIRGCFSKDSQYDQI